MSTSQKNKNKAGKIIAASIYQKMFFCAKNKCNIFSLLFSRDYIRAYISDYYTVGSILQLLARSPDRPCLCRMSLDVSYLSYPQLQLIIDSFLLFPSGSVSQSTVDLQRLGVASEIVRFMPKEIMCHCSHMATSISHPPYSV